MTFCTDGEYKRILDHLRSVVPPPKGCTVHVSRVDAAALPDMAGWCNKHRTRVEIQLSREVTPYEAEPTLLHDWAHMLAWRPHYPLSGDHGPDWGVWYSLCWRQYYKAT